MDSSPAPPLRATVIVLAYNSAPFLQGCLDELARSRDVELEIIFVDNASHDDSHAIASRHPAVTHAIRSEANLGYSGGNNLALPHATAPYLVFVNPDCRVTPGALRALLQPLADDPTIAATGALLLYPNSRRIQHAGGILHPNAMCEHRGDGRLVAPEFLEDRDVDFVTGALIAFRREDFLRLGGFDTDYWPAYYEETDLCFRLRREGRRIRYVAGAVAYHWESPGLVRHSARFVRTSYRSRLRFVVKNYGLRDWLTRFLPFEARWFVGPFARGYRLPVLRSYLSGALFALWCLLRGSRRPRRGAPGQTNP